MNDVVEIREVDIDRIRYEIESEKMIDRMEEVNMPMLTGFGGGPVLNLQDHGLNIDPAHMVFNSSMMTSLGFTDESSVHFTMNCEYINQLITSLKMFRTRLVILPPLKCLEWHRDNFPRIHIPVWTHKGSFIVVKNSTYFLNTGQAYFVNTTNMHTAMNCHRSQNRLHIIGSVHEILGQ
tara:strand:- start:7320 stop:7856 length:537 start_codon:yes stop_codon:yes gene_type:complete